MADVKVPQKDGSISIARNGSEPTTRHVSDHIVQVADEDLDHFLLHVEGSTIAPDTGSKNKE